MNCRFPIINNLQIDVDLESLINEILPTISYKANGEHQNTNLAAKAFKGLEKNLRFHYSKSKLTQYGNNRLTQDVEQEQWEDIQKNISVVTNFIAKRYASFSIFSIPPFVGALSQKESEMVG